MTRFACKPPETSCLLSNLFTELRPVCGRCEGDNVVLCGLTYEGEEQTVVLLGFRTYMTDSGKVVRKLRRESKNRIRRKLKKFRHLLDEGRITFETVVQSYSSWIGHAAHGNSYHLIRNTDKLFYDLFRKEMGEYHVKTTVDASRRRDREVGQHEV